MIVMMRRKTNNGRYMRWMYWHIVCDHIFLPQDTMDHRPGEVFERGMDDTSCSYTAKNSTKG